MLCAPVCPDLSSGNAGCAAMVMQTCSVPQSALICRQGTRAALPWSCKPALRPSLPRVVVGERWLRCHGHAHLLCAPVCPDLSSGNAGCAAKICADQPVREAPPALRDGVQEVSVGVTKPRVCGLPLHTSASVVQQQRSHQEYSSYTERTRGGSLSLFRCDAGRRARLSGSLQQALPPAGPGMLHPHCTPLCSPLACASTLGVLAGLICFFWTAQRQRRTGWPSCLSVITGFHVITSHGIWGRLQQT